MTVDVISPGRYAVCDSCGRTRDGEVVIIAVCYSSENKRNTIRLCKECVRTLKRLL